MTIGIALKCEDVRVDDYEIINAYAGRDKRWLDVLSAPENILSIISFSRTVVSAALIAARYESKER